MGSPRCLMDTWPQALGRAARPGPTQCTRTSTLTDPCCCGYRRHVHTSRLETVRCKSPSPGVAVWISTALPGFRSRGPAASRVGGLMTGSGLSLQWGDLSGCSGRGPETVGI